MPRKTSEDKKTPKTLPGIMGQYKKVFLTLNTNFSTLGNTEKTKYLEQLSELRNSYVILLSATNANFLTKATKEDKTNYDIVNADFYYWKFIIEHKAEHRPEGNQAILALAEMKHELITKVEEFKIAETNPELYKNFISSVDDLIQYTYERANISVAYDKATTDSRELITQLTSTNTAISTLLWIWQYLMQCFISTSSETNQETEDIDWAKWISLTFGALVALTQLRSYAKEKRVWHKVPSNEGIKPDLISLKMFEHLINTKGVEQAIQLYIATAKQLKQSCLRQNSKPVVYANALCHFSLTGLITYINNCILPPPLLSPLRNFVTSKLLCFFLPKHHIIDHPLSLQQKINLHNASTCE